jgi:hypothetical protein
MSNPNTMCHVHGCDNVHVHGMVLADHYILPERILCSGSGKTAPELRKHAVPNGQAPKLKSG